MITLTDGNKTIVLTKREMEIIEDGLRELRSTFINQEYDYSEINNIFDKFRGLKYE